MSLGIFNAMRSVESSLDYHLDRQGVLASNVTNADTPNYQAKDLDFRKVMKQTSDQLNVNLSKTQSSHFDAGHISGDDLIYRTPLNPAADGNTVEVHYEQQEFGKESSRYMATLQFIEGRIGSIRRALRGE